MRESSGECRRPADPFAGPLVVAEALRGVGGQHARRVPALGLGRVRMHPVAVVRVARRRRLRRRSARRRPTALEAVHTHNQGERCLVLTGSCSCGREQK